MDILLRNVAIDPSNIPIDAAADISVSQESTVPNTFNAATIGARTATIMITFFQGLVSATAAADLNTTAIQSITPPKPKADARSLSTSMNDKAAKDPAIMPIIATNVNTV